MPIARSSVRRVISTVPPVYKALRFPTNVSGSDTAAPYAVIEFANPGSNGLPEHGPSNLGYTYFRRIKTYQQDGYYAQFWYSRADGVFNPSEYYFGGHPYPQSGNNTGTTHYWEWAADGGDWTVTRAAGTYTVVHGSVLTQALRYTRNSSNSITCTLFVNLPSTADADVVEYTLGTTGIGDRTVSTTPKLIIGDSPWYAGYQHERAAMDLYAHLIVAKSMSDADIVTQSADLTVLSTTDSQNNIWHGKKGFLSVDDLMCDFGTGRSFTRNDASNVLEVVTI